jgi:hypothetical protein
MPKRARPFLLYFRQLAVPKLVKSAGSATHRQERQEMKCLNWKRLPGNSGKMEKS